jgi:hypothetical protein
MKTEPAAAAAAAAAVVLYGLTDFATRWCFEARQLQPIVPTGLLLPLLLPPLLLLLLPPLLLLLLLLVWSVQFNVMQSKRRIRPDSFRHQGGIIQQEVQPVNPQ